MSTDTTVAAYSRVKLKAPSAWGQSRMPWCCVVCHRTTARGCVVWRSAVRESGSPRSKVNRSLRSACWSWSWSCPTGPHRAPLTHHWPGQHASTTSATRHQLVSHSRNIIVVVSRVDWYRTVSFYSTRYRCPFHLRSLHLHLITKSKVEPARLLTL